MSFDFSKAQWRKTTDVDREYAVFELMHRDVILLDVGYSDDGVWGNPGLGVLLIYAKRGGDHDVLYSSKGNMLRIREWVRSTHDDPLPVGLFVPFERAWLAVKEFIKTEGKLPTSIEWIANRDLPQNTFRDP